MSGKLERVGLCVGVETGSAFDVWATCEHVQTADSIVAKMNVHDDLVAAVKDLLACFWDGRPKRNVKRDYHLMVQVEAANKALRKAGVA